MDPTAADPSQGAAVGLPVAAVARRLGVAPATLRTWDRRYGLGPTSHTAGAHRRYTAPDLARLETMRRLTLEGVPPGDAARVALGQSEAVPPRARPGRGGPGGRVLALAGAAEVARGLGRAGMALDARTATAIVRAELAARGVVATWEHVLRPVLEAVGDRWATTGEGVEVEHLLADCIAVALREVAEGAHEPLSGRPVLLACAPDEQHALPLYALAAGLAERGVGCRTLGPALPAGALEAAVRRTGPALLFLWSQLPATAAPEVVADLPVMRPPTAVVVGGPGWRGARLPPKVRLVRTLSDAVEAAADAVGA